MAKTDFKSKIKINTYDDLFGGPVSLNEVKYLSLNELHDFKDHPFQVKDDEDMNKLVESIKEQGVLDPAIVRHRKEGGFEIISGHRRHHAAMLAGLKDMPVIIRDISDDEATLAMVDANLHREKLLPSEKAFAYKMKLDALRRKAGRPVKNNSRQVVGNYESADMVGQETGESGRQIQRYIRLTELIPEILDMVDDGQMAMRPAIELSFIPKVQQGHIWECMDAEQCTPSHAQAIRMRSNNFFCFLVITASGKGDLSI